MTGWGLKENVLLLHVTWCHVKINRVANVASKNSMFDAFSTRTTIGCLNIRRNGYCFDSCGLPTATVHSSDIQNVIRVRQQLRHQWFELQQNKTKPALLCDPSFVSCAYTTVCEYAASGTMRQDTEKVYNCSAIGATGKGWRQRQDTILQHIQQQQHAEKSTRINL